MGRLMKDELFEAQLLRTMGYAPYGAGAMIIDEDVPFRPDWENVIAPVVNFVLEQPGIDPDRIALMGLSFGGYLAPQAATKEHRLAACISDCGPYDRFDATVSRLPGVLAAQLPNGRPALLRLLHRIATFVMNKPTAGWALRRNLMVRGLTDPVQYFRMAPQYSLKGIEHEIRCPTFVCSTDADDLGVNAPRLFDALTCPGKKYVQFAAVDGAGEHCESGARTAFHQQAFDWLDDPRADHRRHRSVTSRAPSILGGRFPSRRETSWPPLGRKMASSGEKSWPRFGKDQMAIDSRVDMPTRPTLRTGSLIEAEASTCLGCCFRAKREGPHNGVARQ